MVCNRPNSSMARGQTSGAQVCGPQRREHLPSVYAYRGEPLPALPILLEHDNCPCDILCVLLRLFVSRHTVDYFSAVRRAGSCLVQGIEGCTYEILRAWGIHFR